MISLEILKTFFKNNIFVHFQRILNLFDPNKPKMAIFPNELCQDLLERYGKSAKTTRNFHLSVYFLKKVVSF